MCCSYYKTSQTFDELDQRMKAHSYHKNKFIVHNLARACSSCVGSYQVLGFPPTSQKHMGRWTDYTVLPRSVNGCTVYCDILVSHSGCKCRCNYHYYIMPSVPRLCSRLTVILTWLLKIDDSLQLNFICIAYLTIGGGTMV